ncbi:hypothetical protein NRIC_21200 [Enterococcus florum]|uniref:DUF3841 domain-containing protein n=1 Tax=Enterococcus florum TaxID=2480627 RepID=A0A4V0WPL0_9ENTE|nr:hypothetical protein [Enterococcus florum]GCF94229.1 hypothetical protein NRIC_21200 [Enterococcus florum]
MKIYTIQERGFLKNVDAEGFIIPRCIDPELSVFTDDEEALWALEWMKEQFKKRVQVSLDRDFIWVWRDICHLNHARNDGFPGFERYAFFTFEVPAKYYKQTILWSNFINWHIPLNRFWKEYEDEKERYEMIFDLPKKPKYGYVQGGYHKVA